MTLVQYFIKFLFFIFFTFHCLPLVPCYRLFPINGFFIFTGNFLMQFCLSTQFAISKDAFSMTISYCQILRIIQSSFDDWLTVAASSVLVFWSMAPTLLWLDTLMVFLKVAMEELSSGQTMALIMNS